MRFCQGTNCHEYRTKDRIRGTKGSKHYQTRRRSSFYYGQGNFCSLRCQEDWLTHNIERALNHFGRTTQPIVLHENNAWRKTHRWSWQSNTNETTYYMYNMVTQEERPITEQQYNNKNYTLNT